MNGAKENGRREGSIGWALTGPTESSIVSKNLSEMIEFQNFYIIFKIFILFSNTEICKIWYKNLIMNYFGF